MMDKTFFMAALMHGSIITIQNVEMHPFHHVFSNQFQVKESRRQDHKSRISLSPTSLISPLLGSWKTVAINTFGVRLSAIVYSEDKPQLPHSLFMLVQVEHLVVL